MTADDPKTFDPDAAAAGDSDGEGQDQSLEQSVERLKTELAEKTAEATRNYDLYLRERAEIENFKKRMQRDKSDALRFAVEPLVRDLLPVVDNLERALEHAASGGNGQPLLEGVRLVLKNALDVLARHGVTRVEANAGRLRPQPPRGDDAGTRRAAAAQPGRRAVPARVPPARPPAPPGPGQCFQQTAG